MVWQVREGLMVRSRAVMMGFALAAVRSSDLWLDHEGQEYSTQWIRAF